MDMKKMLTNLRDTLSAGLLFLLPLLIVIVLLTKGINLLSGLSTKLAAMFGLKSMMGLSGGTIMSGLLLIAICLLCGYLMRISFVKRINNYADQKLEKHIPGYSVYRQMARSKIEKKEEVLPYKHAAWIQLEEKVFEPAFVMEEIPGNSYVVFIPLGGNAKEGKLAVFPTERVHLIPGMDVKVFQSIISGQGKGIGSVQIPQLSI